MKRISKPLISFIFIFGVLISPVQAEIDLEKMKYSTVKYALMVINQ